MSRISTVIRSNREGFAIFLAMLLTVLIVLMGVYLIDKLVPASKDVKGVEHGNVAYYKAASAVELALSELSGNNPGTQTGSSAGNLSGSGYSLSTVGSGTVVPRPGFGNSEYDDDWNVIAIGRPVQIKLPDGYRPSDLRLEFRVPDLNRNGQSGEQGGGEPSEALSGTVAQIVNWSISTTADTLVSASSQVLTADQINQAAPLSLWSLTGSVLTSTGASSVTDFETANCGSGARCTVKLSLVHSLETRGGQAMPYLEYRLSSAVATPIPQQWTRVVAEGYSRGFKQTKIRNVEQNTVGEALDFTVFQ